MALTILDNTDKQELQNNIDNLAKKHKSATRVFLPSDFADAPIELYKSGKEYLAYHDFEQYRYDTNIYVDHDKGADGSGDGTEEKPFKTLDKAFKSISSDTNIIVKSQTPFGRGEATIGSASAINYNVSFYNANENGKQIVIAPMQLALVWTAEDNVFKTTRSNTLSVLHKDDIDTTFGWVNMVRTNTLDECKATTGTYFVDGTTVYINTFEGTKPTDANYMVCILGVGSNFYLNSNTLFFDGFTFIGYHGADAVIFRHDVADETNAKVVLKNCIAGQNDVGTSGLGNGFAFENIRTTILFNCLAKNTRKDGFNYHFAKATNAADCLAVEVDCVAKNCGLNDSSENNNLTTCHEGARCLRVNHYGRNCKGPMCADVNGCKSIAFGCDVSSSTSVHAYHFELENKGYAMLVDCKSNDIQSVATNGTLYIDNFGGIVNSGTAVVEI